MTEEKHRKFDVIIGNPPFQDESIGNNSKAPSIYHLFMESSYKIGDVVEFYTKVNLNNYSTYVTNYGLSCNINLN